VWRLRFSTGVFTVHRNVFALARKGAKTFKPTPRRPIMTGKRWRASALISLLLLLVSSTSEAADNVYIYDPAVASEVDLRLYLSDGTVQSPSGETYYSQGIQKGPAPEPFPQIAVSERSFEQLGASNVQIDGIVFINHANHYVANRTALVLWIIQVPNAAARLASEFEQDLTLSLWVDWNQDTVWKESERMTQATLNLQQYFPTQNASIQISYLTSFIVPNVAQSMESNKKFDESSKDVRRMWARAVLAYADPDMSPDGGQLFGEYEDYLISYLVAPEASKN
jgi:GEVED domain